MNGLLAYLGLSLVMGSFVFYRGRRARPEDATLADDLRAWTWAVLAWPIPIIATILGIRL